jgi:DNA-3-methyladenine glycosylase II
VAAAPISGSTYRVPSDRDRSIQPQQTGSILNGSLTTSSRPRVHIHHTVKSYPTALTRATLLQGVHELTARDGDLARIALRHGPPPLWARPRGFATLVRIILEQQVSLASAAALYARLERELRDGVTPAAVMALGGAGLLAIGFTRQKAGYVAGLAERVANGTLPLATLARLGDDRAVDALRDVPGIGPWTASIYLLMALRRPDVWPPGDLALHKAMARLHGLATVPTSDEAASIALRWRPWRAVAARLLWHAYLSERAA